MEKKEKKEMIINEDLRESHLRSVLKAVSWRIIATGTTALIAYWVTGEWMAAITIGGVEFLAKLVFYYIHERIWQLAPRGTVRKLYDKFINDRD